MFLFVLVCRETIARVTGGMKVKADRDEVFKPFFFGTHTADVRQPCCLV